MSLRYNVPIKRISTVKAHLMQVLGVDHYMLNRWRLCDHIIENNGDTGNIIKNTMSGVVTLPIHPSGGRNVFLLLLQGMAGLIPRKYMSCSLLSACYQEQFTFWGKKISTL